MFNFLALLDIRGFGCTVASDWPRTFFTARLFLFSIQFTADSHVNYLHYNQVHPNNFKQDNAGLLSQCCAQMGDGGDSGISVTYC